MRTIGNENKQIGEVFIHRRDAGGADNWGQIARISIPPADRDGGARFGTAIDLDGNLLAVGGPGYSPGEFDNQGGAWVFERHLGGAENWGLQRSLLADDPSGQAQFGNDVAISGDTLAVGSVFGGGGGLRSSAAYVYQRDQGGADAWGLVDTLRPPEPAADFGGSVELAGDLLMVGSSAGSSVARGIWFFQHAESKWSLVQEILNEGTPFIDFGSGIDLVRRGAEYFALAGDPKFAIPESPIFVSPFYGKAFFYYYVEPGVVADPGSDTTLITTEAGGSATVALRLTREPSASVTLNVASSDTGEGVAEPATLTFTATDWNVAQTITLTGQDDAEMDGDVRYNVKVSVADSADSDYAAVQPTLVPALNLDDDSPPPDILVSSIFSDTSEDGDSSRFTVRLLGSPSADVTVELTSSDLSEGTVTPSQLVFSQSDPNSVRTVTVVGQDDSIADGDVTYRIETSLARSDDTSFDGLNPADVAVINRDNERGFLFSGGFEDLDR